MNTEHFEHILNCFNENLDSDFDFYNVTKSFGSKYSCYYYIKKEKDDDKNVLYFEISIDFKDGNIYFQNFYSDKKHLVESYQDLFDIINNKSNWNLYLTDNQVFNLYKYIEKLAGDNFINLNEDAKYYWEIINKNKNRVSDHKLNEYCLHYFNLDYRKVKTDFINNLV